MNIQEMQTAIRDLQEMRRQRDKLAEMVLWCKDDGLRGDVKSLSCVMADLWLSVPLNVATTLYENEYCKQETLCVEKAEKLGIDHEVYVSKDE